MDGFFRDVMGGLRAGTPQLKGIDGRALAFSGAGIDGRAPAFSGAVFGAVFNGRPPFSGRFFSGT